MRRIISFFLSFVLLFSNLAFDYENVQAVQTPATQTQGVQTLAATDTTATITFSSDGNLTKPVVTATINTGGKKIVGITYERGYNQTATGTSKRIYGYEGQSGTVAVPLTDVYKYVSVYVVLADADNNKTQVVNSYTLTGNRIYNQSSNTFAIYQTTPLNDDTNADTLVYDTIGTTSGDNGPMIQVDDQVWAFNELDSLYIYETDKLDGYFGFEGTSYDVPRTTIAIEHDLDEHGNSIIYDGRYVTFIDRAGYLYSIDAQNPVYANHITRTRNVNGVFTNYQNFTGLWGGYVAAMVYDNTNIYLVNWLGAIYKATPNGNGTYTIGTTAIGNFGASTGAALGNIDVIYDGTNLWATFATNKVFKFDLSKNQASNYTVKSGAIVSSLVYDGSTYIYAAGKEARQGNINGMYRFTPSDPANGTQVYTDSGLAVTIQEDLVYDGRNIWQLNYSTKNGVTFRYDTKTGTKKTIAPSQIIDRAKTADGGNLQHAVAGVYDGKYQWIFRYSMGLIDAVGRTMNLKFGTTGSLGAIDKDIKKTFDDPKVTDATTIVYVDDKETTSPNYVIGKTSGGVSTSNIVFGAWTYDSTLAAAQTRNDSFFKDLTKAIDTTTLDKADWTQFRGYEGSYFTIPKNELPTVTNGTFSYSLTTYPKQNGWYTLYLVNADGRPYYETVYVNNYKELSRLYINFEDSTTHEVVKQTMDDTFSVGAKATVNFKTYASELEADGYLLDDSQTKTVDSMNASSEMTFLVKKDYTKWTEVIYEPYYVNNSGVEVKLPQVASGLLFLVDDVYKTGDKTDLAKYNRSAKVEAPHVKNFKLTQVVGNESPKTVDLPVENGGSAVTKTYGKTYVKFQYTPDSSVVVVNGIEVDSTGKPTGNTVYSEYTTGNVGDTIKVDAKTQTGWTLVGLTNKDATATQNGVNTFTAKYGTNEVVYFAYTRNGFKITVNYVDNTGKVLSSDEYSAKEGDKLTFVPKEISGYMLASGEPTIKEVTVTANATYTFKYVPLPAAVVVKGIEVDASGQPTGNVVSSKQINGEKGVSQTVTAETLTNWNISGIANYDGSGNFVNVTPGSSKDVVFGNVAEVVFAYTRKMTDVTVKYVLDGTTQEIAFADTFKVPLNSSFTAVGKSIDGYKLKNAVYKQDAGVMNGSQAPIVFEYVRITENVTIVAKLADGTVLGRDSVDLPLGATNVSVGTGDLVDLLKPRYVVDTSVNAATQTIAEVKTDTVVTYVFKEMKSTVTVKYLEQGTNAPIPNIAEKTYTIPFGETYSEYAISIKDYYIADGFAVSYPNNKAANSVENYTFYYTKAAGNILVQAVDSTTGNVLEQWPYNGTNGSNLTVNSSVFKGSWTSRYVLDDASVNASGDKSAIYNSTLQTMTFNYKPQTYTLTLTAKDTTGTALNFYDGNSTKTITYFKGEKYNVYAPPVTGHTVEGTASISETMGIQGNVTHTFTYKPVVLTVALAVKAVDENGKIIGAKTITGNRETKTTIDINDAQFKDVIYDSSYWTLVSAPTKSIEFGKNYEAEFVFKRKAVDLTVQYVNTTSGSSIIRTDVFKVDVNTVEKVVAPTDLGFYQLANGQSAVTMVPIGTDNKTIQINYVESQGTTVIFARDKETGKILEKKFDNPTKGTTNYDAIGLKGSFVTSSDPAYTYDTSSNTKLAVIDEDTSKNVVYLDFIPNKYTVTVKYVDKEGNAVLEPKVYNVNYGSYVEEFAANKAFYNLVSTQKAIQTIKSVTSNVTITFEYEAILIPDAVLNIVAVDENGKILKMDSIRGTVGEKYTYDATYFNDIPGYSLESKDPIMGTFINGYVTEYITYRTKTLEVKVRLVDGATGLDINPTLLTGKQLFYTVQEHQDVTVYAPAVDGYYVAAVTLDGVATANKDFITLKDVTLAKTVTFTYFPIDKVIVKKGIEVDAAGNPVIKNGIESVVYSVIIPGDDNKTTNIQPTTGLANWNYVGKVNYDANGNFLNILKSPDPVPATYGTDKEVVFAYTRNQAKVTVKHVEYNTGGTPIAIDDQVIVPTNTEVTVTAKAIPGYELYDPNGYKETFTATGDITRTFVYKKLEKTVVIQGVDSTGKLLAQYTVDKPLGSTNVAIGSSEIAALLSPRYKLTSAATQTVAKIETNTVVTFVFAEQLSTINVSYVNSSGIAISGAPTKTYTVPYGTKVIESAVSIKDYYVDTTKNPVTQTITAGQPVYNLTFTYANASSSISVIARDGATNQILYYKTYTGNQGTNKTVDMSEFTGQDFLNQYTLDSKVSQTSVTKTFTNTHQDIEFIFSKDTYVVTLKAEDIGDGKSLLFYNGSDTITRTLTKGDTYEVYAPPVDGYYVNPNSTSFYKDTVGIKADVTYTFKYKKVELSSNVTVKVVSEDGSILVGTKILSKDRETEETININEHPDLYNPEEWTVTGVTTAKVIYGKDKEVVFKLKRKGVDVTTQYVATSSSAIIVGAENLDTDVPTNSSYTAIAKIADFYVLAPGQKQSQTINTGTSNKTITFEYVPVNGNILIEAIDADTGQILARQYDNADEGDRYDLSPALKASLTDSLIGYGYQTSAEYIAAVSKDATKNIIKLMYKKQMSTVVVNYVDAEGNSIAPSKSYEVQYGRGFDEYALNFDLYNLTSTVSHIVVTNVNQPRYEYNFVYYLDNANVINAVARTADGQILGLQSFVGTFGNTVELDADVLFGEMTGYTLMDEPVKYAKYSTGLVTVEFIYSIVGLNVTIKAIDKATGFELPFTEPKVISVQEGQNVTVYAPHIAEYQVIPPSFVTFEGITQSQTVIFEYNKIDVPDRIVVKHISLVNGYQVIIKTESFIGNVGDAITVSPLSTEEQNRLGFKVNENYNYSKVLHFVGSTNSDTVFLYDRVMSQLIVNHVTEIYGSHADALAGTNGRLLSESEKAIQAKQLLNTTEKYAQGSTQTIVAPFEAEYVINTTKNTLPLRTNVTLNNATVIKDYYYRNITGNVLIRAVVPDQNGSIVINGKTYKPIAQVDDNCAVGVGYTSNDAKARLSVIEGLLAPGFILDTTQGSLGLIEGNENFVPKAGETYKDHTLTYVFTGNYKTVKISYRDTAGNLLPASQLGITSNPEEIQVIQGDYFTHYAIDVKKYTYTGTQVTQQGSVLRAFADDNLNFTSLNYAPYINMAANGDTNVDVAYEVDNDFVPTTLTLRFGSGANTETISIDLVPGQILYAPYRAGYAPVTEYQVIGTVGSNYEFTYTPIAPVVTTIPGQTVTQYVYRFYDFTEYDLDHSDTEFVHKAYVNGYPDGTIGADKNITRAEVVALLYNILYDEKTDKGTYIGTKFPDVSPNAWYAEAVNYMSAKQYITGYPDGTFKPQQNITREEFAAIMSGIFGTSDVTEFTSLPLDPNRWSTDHIINDYTSGFYDGIDLTNYNFRAKATRAEVIVMINNATNRVPNEEYLATVKAPSDLSVNHWAYYEILEALNDHEGYIKGNFGAEEEFIYTAEYRKAAADAKAAREKAIAEAKEQSVLYRN